MAVGETRLSRASVIITILYTCDYKSKRIERCAVFIFIFSSDAATALAYLLGGDDDLEDILPSLDFV